MRIVCFLAGLRGGRLYSRRVRVISAQPLKFLVQPNYSESRRSRSHETIPRSGKKEESSGLGCGRVDRGKLESGSESGGTIDGAVDPRPRLVLIYLSPLRTLNDLDKNPGRSPEMTRDPERASG